MFQKSVSPTLQCERAKTRHTRHFFRQAGRACLSTKCWSSTLTKSPVTVQSSCFSKANGRRERVPGSPLASTRRWSESRGGHAPVTPLGMEGSESLLLSGLCRLRASSTPRKLCHVRVCGLCVHTRTITRHAQCQALTHSLTHSLPPSPLSLPLSLPL